MCMHVKQISVTIDQYHRHLSLSQQKLQLPQKVILHLNVPERKHFKNTDKLEGLLLENPLDNVHENHACYKIMQESRVSEL